MIGILCDTHVHSTFSHDGRSTVEEMVLSAIEKGVSVLCFTEHFDSDPADKACDFFDYDSFSLAIERVRDKHSDRIEILKGIEFSEPHLHERELELCNERDFDFILGSIHCAANPSMQGRGPFSASALDEIYERHYGETIAACRRGGFDSLAHIDVPARYLAERREPFALIEEALRTMVERGISLEMNTWCLRKGFVEGSPSASILKAYGACGGEYLTAGSDAHCARDVAACMAGAGADDFKPCYYRNRKRILA